VRRTPLFIEPLALTLLTSLVKETSILRRKKKQRCCTPPSSNELHGL